MALVEISLFELTGNTLNKGQLKSSVAKWIFVIIFNSSNLFKSILM